jgi:1,4-alpha-glucan branching enzyme
LITALDGETGRTRWATQAGTPDRLSTEPDANEEFVVVGSAARHVHSQYAIDLPTGKWQEVLSSDATKYGGQGTNNAGSTFSGRAQLNLPAGGFVVLKRMG